MVADGRVRLNREKIDGASTNVKVGDVLTVSLERRVLVLEVLLPGTRRGPAPEAQTLYLDRSAPPEPRPERPPAPEHRPDGRDREAIRRLKRGE